MQGYGLFVRVTKGGDHQPSFLLVLAVTGFCSAWEIINAYYLQRHSLFLARVRRSLGQMPCPLLLMPNATSPCVSWTEALCFSPGKCRSFPLFSQWRALCHSAPEFPSLPLLAGSFFAYAWEKFPPSWSRRCGFWAGLFYDLPLLTLCLWKDGRDGGCWITARCPNNARHLTVCKAPSCSLTYSFSRRDWSRSWGWKANGI